MTLLLSLCAGIAGPALAVPAYQATRLGFLEGQGSWGYGINNAGVVVGRAMDANNSATAFIYSDGVMRHTASVYDGVATRINDRGEYVTDSGVYQLDGTPITNPPRFGSVQAINNQGQMVGYAVLYHEALMYTPMAGTVSLQTLPAGSRMPSPGFTYDISDSGYVVGQINNRAYRYFGGSMHLLDSSGGNSAAYAVNNDGISVGSAWLAADYNPHAALWDSSGRIVDLHAMLPNALYSEAMDINNAGTVVGSYVTTDYDYRGFVYQDGVMYELNSLQTGDYQLPLLGAYAINDSGQIVSLTQLYAYEAVLMNPVSPVPEPPEMLLFACGVAVCLVWMRKMGRASVAAS